MTSNSWHGLGVLKDNVKVNLLEKPTGLRQLLNKFAAFYGTGRYLRVLLSNWVRRVDDEMRLD
jgi:hypothetical protein